MMSRRMFSAALSLVPLLASSVPASTMANTICADVSRDAQTYLAETGKPSIAIGVVKDGRIVCSIAIGVTDFKSGVLVTIDTNFHLASVSKSLAAIAAMQLVMAKKLDLDRPITCYVPYFKMADLRYKKITLQMLLNHRAGLGDVTDYGWDKPQTDNAALSRYVRSLKSEKLLSAPGAKFAYSNIGYEIIGAAIEHVSSESFEAYSQRHIFANAGMTHTSFLYPAPHSSSQAKPHFIGDDGKQIESNIYPYTRSHGPSSNLESNVNDMNRWMVASLAKPSPILSQKGWGLLWTQGAEAIDKDGDDHILGGSRIGLGWFSGPAFGEGLVFHPGEDTGFKAMLMFNPLQRSGIVMMTNSDGPEPGGDKTDLYFGMRLAHAIFNRMQKQD